MGPGSGREFFMTSAADAANVSQTPIPGALPLFASVLGLGGFLGWKRQRKAGAYNYSSGE